MHNIAARRKQAPATSDADESFVNIASKRGKGARTPETVASEPAAQGIEQAMLSIGEQRAERQHWFARLRNFLLTSALLMLGVYLVKSGYAEAMWQAAYPILRDFLAPATDLAPTHCATATQGPFGHIAGSLTTTMVPMFRLLALISLMFGVVNFVVTGKASSLVAALAMAPMPFFLPTMLSMVVGTTC